MVEIEAECPSCGLIQVAAERWHMVVYPERPDLSYCGFTCGCDRDVTVLVSPGMIATLWHLIPSRLEHIPREALEEHTGSALTEDDYITFMREMQQLP